MKPQLNQNQFIPRPPIIVVLGHVDHGKTTLLDTIRKTNIAAKEHGGITQHIGAYQIEPLKGKKVTFIDTPGHEAFAKMRGRGAKVADLAILVVAANDGVMPQTIESIKHIKDASLPCIVALNKIDLPGISQEHVKQQLVKNGLNLEEFGGEVPVVPISAKEGKGIEKLLEMIFLLSELNEIRENPSLGFQAVVIESSLSKNRGPQATLIVRNGILNKGDIVFCNTQQFKVRSLISWQGENLSSVTASTPVLVLGWKQTPEVGSLVVKEKEKISTKKTDFSIRTDKAFYELDKDVIKLIIKADTVGSLETILDILNKKKEILIVESGVGEIVESDIFLAKTTGSLIIGFNVKTTLSAFKLAEGEKVNIKTYDIIYELINEIDDVIDALKKGNLVTVLGVAKVIAIFHIKDQIVAGVKVISGRIARGDQVKVTRNENEIARTRIKSLRQQKLDINTASQDMEAGVLLSQNVPLLTGDSIISIK